jgi:Immunoglobulin domain
VLPKLKPFNTGEDPLFMGDFFQLICSVTSGDSPFTFNWLFQNESLESSYETRIEETKRSSTLSIESVSAKHTGEYTCKVLNKAGFASITTALVVKGEQ